MSGGVEERVVGKKKRIGSEGEREEELERGGEMCDKKFKRKVAGMDGIIEAVWKYEGEEVERWL